ncbi:MAG: glycosyltransferase family 1 protein, partial [Kamptonema sp. SIO4C4]|nr:glycosyltransferase family 1 protein [Kamptonema sp. SIO4C4]
AQFNGLIASFDILFIAYEDYPYSSNILTKASFLSKPVIVSEGFRLGERVKNYNLGVTIPERNPTKAREAIHYLCKQIDQNLQQLKPEFSVYNSLHSQDRLRHLFDVTLVGNN